MSWNRHHYNIEFYFNRCTETEYSTALQHGALFNWCPLHKSMGLYFALNSSNFLQVMVVEKRYWHRICVWNWLVFYGTLSQDRCWCTVKHQWISDRCLRKWQRKTVWSRDSLTSSSVIIYMIDANNEKRSSWQQQNLCKWWTADCEEFEPLDITIEVANSDKFIETFFR